jgi:hypothetical protein
MAASGGLAARKTQPDDQPTKIPTGTDDTTAAEERLNFSRPFLRFALWLAAYVAVGLLLAVFVQSFVNWLLS